ncbi:MAG TPA: DUF1549 domain-containing protein [Pirellulales bacterium]|jgi:hypothetical protein
MNKSLLGCTTGLLCGVLILHAGSGRAGDLAENSNSPAAADLARQVDSTLAAELLVNVAATEPVGNVSPPNVAALTDDETFLRRVSQDLVGELPSPEEITSFVLDPSSDKRAQIVDRLLADARFGRNWGQYFRDVILYRRTDERVLRTGPAIVKFLAEQLSGEARWDQIARAFITARGDVRDNGHTGLIMAQMAQAPEIAAETARIFLGVQIQCAQCHDHKTDRWKRQQFHELAAFFPRIAIRAVKEGDKRVSFEVVSRDGAPRRPKDGKARGNVEHYMPDLDDPSAQGTLMQPVFFLSGEQLAVGTTDVDRRTALADWITGKKNPWFGRAFVNRIWAELVGHGFYEPVDDMGPDRTAAAPRTLDLLTQAFVDHNYDVKWLMRTIMATQAYQQVSHSRRDDASTPSAASCPQPLRADQIFDALAAALAIDEPKQGPRAQAGKQRPPRNPRFEFDRAFGYDPSAERDEVSASIPQALLMMNSPLLQRAINAKSAGAVLDKLLAQNSDDENVTTELYLRCLAREPKPAEMAECLSYVRSIDDRGEAFEDVLWALINSTEFTHRK